MATSNMGLGGSSNVTGLLLAVHDVEQDSTAVPECRAHKSSIGGNGGMQGPQMVARNTSSNMNASSSRNSNTALDQSFSTASDLTPRPSAMIGGYTSIQRSQYQQEINQQIENELNAVAGVNNAASPTFTTAAARSDAGLQVAATPLPATHEAGKDDEIMHDDVVQVSVSRARRRLAPFSSPQPRPIIEHGIYGPQIAQVPTEAAETRLEGWLGGVYDNQVELVPLQPSPLIDALLQPKVNNTNLVQDMFRVAKEQVRRHLEKNQQDIRPACLFIRQGIQEFGQFGHDAVQAGRNQNVPAAPMPATFPENSDVDELDELYWALGRLPKQAALTILGKAATLTKCILKLPAAEKTQTEHNLQHASGGHPGDHPRWSFQDGNYTQHPHSQIINIFRSSNMSAHDFKMLVVDTYNQLYHLGEVRQVSVPPIFPGTSFEIIPYIQFNAIFSGTWANVDGKIVAADRVWDMSVIGIPKTMESYYAHFENRFT